MNACIWLVEYKGNLVKACDINYLLSGVPLWLNILTRACLFILCFIVSLFLIVTSLKYFMKSKKGWRNNLFLFLLGLIIFVTSLSLGLDIWKMLI